MEFDERLVNWKEMRDLVIRLRELLELEPSDPGNLNQALSNILNVARNLFPPTKPGEGYPDICTLSIYNPFNQQLIRSLFIKGEVKEYSEIRNDVPFEPIVKSALEKERLFIEDLPEHPELGDSLSFAENLQSIAAVSFYTTKPNRKPLAVLCLGFRTRHKFAPDKRDFLDMLVDAGSPILQTIWLLKRYNDVAAIGQEINQNFADMRTLFQKIGEHLPQIINTSYCFMLGIRQRHTDRLDFYVVDRGDEKILQDRPLKGASARVILRNETLLIRHASAEPELAAQLEQLPGTNPDPSESLIFVPLSFRGRVLGILSIQHDQPNMFHEDDVHILEVLSYHIALAISTRHLYQSLDGLNLTGLRLLQQLDSDQLLQILADEIRICSGADLVDFYPYLRDKRRFDLPPRASGQFIQPDFDRPSVSRPDDVSVLSLDQKETVFARDSRTLYQLVGGNPSNRLGNFEEREAILSTAAVPLRVGDDDVGVLFLNFRTEQSFDAAQRNLIDNLGHYAAIAIRNSRVFADQKDRRAEMLEVLRKIDREISKTLELKLVLQTILDLTIKYISEMKSSSGETERIPIDGAILLYDRNTNLLEAKATAGPRARFRIDRFVSLVDDQGITSWAFKNKETVRVKDVQKDSKFKKLYYVVDNFTRSELDAPLLDGKEAIGVINLESTRADAFSELAEEFLTNVAERAVLAIKNAQIFERERRSRQELETTRSVERQIVGRQIKSKVYETILEGALLITGAKSGHIILQDKQKGDLYVVAEKGMPPEKMGGRMTHDQGIVGWVMRNKKAENVDVTDGEWKNIYHETIPGIRYELAVPIGLREPDTSREVQEAFGVINLEKEDEPPFTDEDLNSLTQFANQVLVTLQNPGGSNQVLDALREIDLQIIGANSSLDDVMQVIIRYAMELTRADTGNLHVYEGAMPTVTFCALRDDKGMVVAQSRKDEVEVEELPARLGIVAHVAETLEPYHTEDDAQVDPYFKGGKDVHSNIAVPLLTGNELTGVLNLESKGFGAFDDDHVSWLRAIASQAVIAIQKVRGNVYAADSLKRFKLLSNAGQELLKLSGPKSVDNAYRIIIEIVHEYLPCNAAIWSYDKEKEELHCEFEKGVTDTGRRYEHKALKKGQGVNGYVAQQLPHRPIVINDAANLQEDQPKPVLSNPNTRSVAVYPIFISGNGEMFYYGNLSLTHERPHFFKQDFSELFIGLTQQLAVTLNRLKTVKERGQAQQQAATASFGKKFGTLEKLAFDHAHSLGNLLGPVKSYIRRAQNALDKEPRDLLLINRELDRIQKQVEAVLDRQRAFYARATGLGDPANLAQPEIIALSVLLAQAERNFPPIPDNIKLTIENQGGHATVRVVLDRVAEILFNLITNAIEAMPEGGEIALTTRVAEDNVELLVQDTGNGISTDKIDEIFNMLFTTKPEGLGFGLWSSRIDAENDSGKLTVKSEPGHGSTFILTLPLVRGRD